MARGWVQSMHRRIWEAHADALAAAEAPTLALVQATAWVALEGAFCSTFARQMHLSERIPTLIQVSWLPCAAGGMRAVHAGGCSNATFLVQALQACAAADNEQELLEAGRTAVCNQGSTDLCQRLPIYPSRSRRLAVVSCSEGI